MCAFANVRIGIATRARTGTFWLLFEIFKERTQKDMEVVKGFIEPVVHEEMKKREQGGDHEKHESPLQHLLDVTKGNMFQAVSLLASHIDEKFIVYQTLKYVKCTFLANSTQRHFI